MPDNPDNTPPVTDSRAGDTTTNGHRPSDDPDRNPFEDGNSELFEREMERKVVHIVGDSASSTVGCIVTPDPADDAVAEAKARVADAIAVADEMFSHSAVLEHVAAWADARGSSRVGVLEQVLMRATLAIPPRVVLPAYLGGDYAGLSLLLAVTGVRAGGKGRAETLGRDAVVLRCNGRVCRFEPMTPSTGEGLVSMFAETQRDPQSGRTRTAIHTPSVLLSFKDIESFGKLATRSGATLPATLLSLYMGDHLGFFTRERERRVTLPAHTVVGGLSAGVQPDMGKVLLNPEMQASGMPHRFLWTPVRGGRRTARITPPPPITVDLPDFGATTDPLVVETAFLPGEGVDVSDLVVLDVDRAVAEEIIAADMQKDLDVFGGVPDGEDQLYGHLALTRLKVAAALGALHGVVGITEPWWELAGPVIDMSKEVMHAVAVALGAAEIASERQTGERLGERYAAADQRRDDAKVRDVAQRLYDRVSDDWGPVNAKAVIGLGKHRLIPEAWELLIDTGKVEAMEYEYRPGQKTMRYRRTQC